MPELKRQTGMKIYTKTGDKGQTGLGDGSRVAKNDPRIEAYGTIDELNALLGLCACSVKQTSITDVLTGIQGKLFAIGSVLANPKHSANFSQATSTDPAHQKLQLSDADVVLLEKQIDTHETTLQPLRSFILPGGSTSAAYLHLARTVCRRAERRLLTLKEKSALPDLYVVYLNRLSDLLFVWARSENHQQNKKDIPW